VYHDIKNVLRIISIPYILFARVQPKAQKFLGLLTAQ